MAELRVGLEFIKDYPIKEGNLSTQAITALMENAAMNCAKPSLPERYTTVGTRMNIKHFAPGPNQGNLRVTAQLTEIDGKRLTFKVKVEWQNETISEGQHERFVVDEEFARTVALVLYIHSHETLDIDFDM